LYLFLSAIFTLISFFVVKYIKEKLEENSRELCYSGNLSGYDLFFKGQSSFDSSNLRNAVYSIQIKCYWKAERKLSHLEEDV